MAKVGKIKKKPATPHSRASRRALSPSLSISVSKTLPSPSTNPRPPVTSKPHILSASTSSGIRKPKYKQLKHSQRVRQQAGIQRAFDVMDKREVKVLKSVVKEKKVEGVGGKGGRGKGNLFEALEDGGLDLVEDREREWVSDEEMPEVEVPEERSEVLEEAVQGEVKEAVVPESVPLPVATTLEEDELL
ncbi:hypothetical protein BCR34DRAFT_609740 [Clohesyomyces aquaticus]|uniref:Alb1-domain-containing protein n=1 Tax=Clohesyomyces aquaticus TaxID=1231657 RepID=A0A1Y2ABE6_9PLEO|nr:hypothetical protein BCR34DRAFT_609740 [Clohesyomyces aquaticus]